MIWPEGMWWVPLASAETPRRELCGGLERVSAGDVKEVDEEVKEGSHLGSSVEAEAEEDLRGGKSSQRGLTKVEGREERRTPTGYIFHDRSMRRKIGRPIRAMHVVAGSPGTISSLLSLRAVVSASPSNAFLAIDRSSSTGERASGEDGATGTRSAASVARRSLACRCKVVEGELWKVSSNLDSGKKADEPDDGRGGWTATRRPS